MSDKEILTGQEALDSCRIPVKDMVEYVKENRLPGETRQQHRGRIREWESILKKHNQKEKNHG